MTITIYSSKKQHILYDAEPLPQIDLQLFEPTYWRDQGRLSEPYGGRGQAFFVRHPAGFEYLLRHYRRGGLIAHISQDRYLFTGLKQSRPFREFQLTHELFMAGFPVPRPLAARVLKKGLFYQGDLITARIPQSQPFAHYVQQSGFKTLWQAVGAMIARFHLWGLNHVDLNVNNILISEQGQPWLIDFDRCYKKSVTDSRWQQANIQRLARSVRKTYGQETLPEQWQYLQTSYQETKRLKHTPGPPA